MTVAICLIVLLVVAVIVVGTIIAIAAVSAKKEAVTVATGEASYFDGNTWQFIGYTILSALVTTLTLGIAYPWMLCMMQRWEVKHTVIHGRRLKFNGHGHQLIGKYLLWVFLTVITFGIYGIWLGLGMKKWVVKHTVYADEESPVDSYFSGGAGGYLGIHILSFILTLFTFGIGKAWADKTVLKWEAKHTHIGGSPLEFNGTGGQLFVKYLILVLLTPLTLGIYALFFTVIYMKWEVKHTEAVYQTPEIQTKAKAHELTAVQDFAKYRIAANDQEIAAMKSGYTGTEDQATLKQMAEEGNPFAAYHLAKQLKGENTLYEDEALELLQKAANEKVHSALLDLAKQSSAEQKASLLTQAAQCGNAQASWLLVGEYKSANNLPQAAYWFKVAMEWDVADATTRAAEYDEIVKKIALQLSENRVIPQQEKKKISPIALWSGIAVAGILLVVGIVFGVMFVNAINNPSNSFMGSRVVRVFSDSMAPDIKSGDVIYLDDDVSAIEAGDIIAFIYDENMTIAAHRVIKIITDDDGGVLYVTKADNNTTPDTDPVHPSNIIGVYERKAGFFGKILGMFSSNSLGGAKGNAPTQLVTYDWNAELKGVGSEDSPYIIANAYDFQKYVSYSGENYGTITADFEICTDYVYYGSNEANFDCFQQQVQKGYIRFQNEDIKVTYEGIEVICENLSDMSYADTSADSNTVEPTYPTEPETNLASAIVGDWVCYDMLTNMTTGDDTLEVWDFTFNSDGTYGFVHNECMVSTEGNIYYGGRCWMAALGYGQDGTYSVNGDKLTVQYHLDGENAVLSSTTYTVELHENVLSIYCDGWGRTRDFERK